MVNAPERIGTFIKKAGTELRLTPVRVGVAVTPILVTYPTLELDPGVRGHLPRPIDYFNHGTNFSVSVEAAAVVGGLAGAAYMKAAKAPTPRRARALAVASASALLIAANTLAETRYGLSLLHWHTIPDPYDLAWGVAGTAVGSGVAASAFAAVPEAAPAAPTEPCRSDAKGQ